MAFQNILNLQNFLNWIFSHGVRIIIILVVGFVVSKIAKIFILKFLRKFIIKSLKFANGDKEVDEERERTIARVAVSVVQLAIWIVVILTILPEFGVNIGPLLAGLGVAGLALSFGARSLIQDYLAGIFILLEDHYRVGEKVELLSTKGKIKDFNLRRTVIQDTEGNLHYIPNSQIKKASNFSRK